MANYQYNSQRRDTNDPNNSQKWLEILNEKVHAISPNANHIIVDYAISQQDDVSVPAVVIATGQVILDYTEDTVSTPRLINIYDTGDYHSVVWAVDIGNPDHVRWISLVVSTELEGIVVHFNVASDKPPWQIYDQRAWDWVITYSSVENPRYAEVVHSLKNDWAVTGVGDMYNDNTTGRVGVGTGNRYLSNTLEVAGSQLLEGSLILNPPGQSGVQLTSNVDMGHLFQVRSHANHSPFLYMDANGQLGIDTNSPVAKLHVVGTGIVSEWLSVGDASIPNPHDSRLSVRAVGTSSQKFAFKVVDGTGKRIFSVRDDGEIYGTTVGGGGLGDPVTSFESEGNDTLKLELSSGTQWTVNVPILTNGKIDSSQIPDGAGGSSIWRDLGTGTIEPKEVLITPTTGAPPPDEGLRKDPYVNLGKGWNIGTGDLVTSFGNTGSVDWTNDEQVVSAKAISNRSFTLDDLTDVDINSTFSGYWGSEGWFLINEDHGDVVNLFPAGSEVEVDTITASPQTFNVVSSHHDSSNQTWIELNGVGPSGDRGYISSSQGAASKSFIIYDGVSWKSNRARLDAHLEDVVITNATDGNILTFDGTKWSNSASGGSTYLSKVANDQTAGSIGIKTAPSDDIALTVGGFFKLGTGAKVSKIKDSASDLFDEGEILDEREHTLLTQSAIEPHINKKQARINGIVNWDNGQLNIDSTGATLRVEAGKGRIYNAYLNTDDYLPTLVQWDVRSYAITELTSNATFGVVHVHINGTNGVEFSHDPLSNSEARDKIYLGYVTYKTTAGAKAFDAAFPAPAISDSTGTAFEDYLRFLHVDHQLSGAYVEKGTVIRQIYTTSGTLFYPGISYFTTAKNPNILSVAENGNSTTDATYVHVISDGTQPPPTGNVDILPDWYNDLTDNTVPVKRLNGTEATIHAIYSLMGGDQYILYGQGKHVDKDAAKLELETYKANLTVPEGLDNAIFLAYAIVDAADVQIFNKGGEVIGSVPPANTITLDTFPTTTTTGTWTSNDINNLGVWEPDPSFSSTKIIRSIDPSTRDTSGGGTQDYNIKVHIGNVPTGTASAIPERLVVHGSASIDNAVRLPGIPITTTLKGRKYIVRSDASNQLEAVSTENVSTDLGLNDLKLGDLTDFDSSPTSTDSFSESTREVIVKNPNPAADGSNVYEQRGINFSQLADVAISTPPNGAYLRYKVEQGVGTWIAPETRHLTDTVIGGKDNTEILGLKRLEFDDEGRAKGWETHNLDTTYAKIGSSDVGDTYGSWNVIGVTKESPYSTTQIPIASGEDLQFEGATDNVIIRVEEKAGDKSVNKVIFDVKPVTDQYIDNITFQNHSLHFTYKREDKDDQGDIKHFDIPLSDDTGFALNSHAHAYNPTDKTGYDYYGGWKFTLSDQDGTSRTVGPGGEVKFISDSNVNIQGSTGTNDIRISANLSLKDLDDLKDKSPAANQLIGWSDTGEATIVESSSLVGDRQVKSSANDVNPGYLNDKIAVSGDLSVDRKDELITIHSPVLVQDGAITSNTTYSSQKIDSLITNASKGIKYVWASEAERDAQQGQSTGDQGLVDASGSFGNRPVYSWMKPDGTTAYSWVHMYDMGTATVDLSGYLPKDSIGAPGEVYIGNDTFRQLAYADLTGTTPVPVHSHDGNGVEPKIQFRHITGITSDQVIDHSTITIAADDGLTGGGVLTGDISIAHSTSSIVDTALDELSLVQNVKFDAYGHVSEVVSQDLETYLSDADNAKKLPYVHPAATTNITGSLTIGTKPIATEDYVGTQVSNISLDSLTDVSIPGTPVEDSVLVKDAGSNTYSVKQLSFNQLQEIDTSSAADGDSLVLSTGKWVPSTPPVYTGTDTGSGTEIFNAGGNKNIAISSLKIDSQGRVTEIKSETDLDLKYMPAGTPVDDYGGWSYKVGADVVRVTKDSEVEFVGTDNVQLDHTAGQVTIKSVHSHKLGELSDVSVGTPGEMITWGDSGTVKNVDPDTLKTYEVKASANDDSPGYLNDKIQQGDGITVTETPTGITLTNQIRIDDTGMSSDSVYSSRKTDELLKTSSQGIKYEWATVAAMVAQTDATAGDTGIQNEESNRPVYKAKKDSPATKADWEVLYHMDSNSDKYLVKADTGPIDSVYVGNNQWKKVNYTELAGTPPITAHSHNGSDGWGEIRHADLVGLVANEHVDHTSVVISTGDGLTGGGDLTQSRAIVHEKFTARNPNNSGTNFIQSFTVNTEGHITAVSSSDVEPALALDTKYLSLGGGTLTGPITLPTDASNDNYAATVSAVKAVEGKIPTDLNDLNGINVSSPTAGDLLQYNTSSGEWGNNKSADLVLPQYAKSDLTLEIVGDSFISPATSGPQPLTGNIRWDLSHKTSGVVVPLPLAGQYYTEITVDAGGHILDAKVDSLNMPVVTASTMGAVMVSSGGIDIDGTDQFTYDSTAGLTVKSDGDVTVKKLTPPNKAENAGTIQLGGVRLQAEAVTSHTATNEVSDFTISTDSTDGKSPIVRMRVNARGNAIFNESNDKVKLIVSKFNDPAAPPDPSPNPIDSVFIANAIRSTVAINTASTTQPSSTLHVGGSIALPLRVIDPASNVGAVDPTTVNIFDSDHTVIIKDIQVRNVHIPTADPSNEGRIIMIRIAMGTTRQIVYVRPEQGIIYDKTGTDTSLTTARSFILSNPGNSFACLQSDGQNAWHQIQ